MICRSTPSVVPRATCLCSGVRCSAMRRCTERRMSASRAGMSPPSAWRTANLVVELLTTPRLFHGRLVEVQLVREHLVEHVPHRRAHVQAVQLLALELFEVAIHPRKAISHWSFLLA